MSNTVRDIMTPNPVTLSREATITDAAREMKMNDIGDVIIMDGNTICGIVTDRDIVVRAVAEHDISRKLGEICSERLVSIAPTEPIERAVQMMREHAVRRLPVVEGGKVLGIVSLGDVAIDRDQKSCLGEISRAPANV